MQTASCVIVAADSLKDMFFQPIIPAFLLLEDLVQHYRPPFSFSCHKRCGFTVIKRNLNLLY